jgi:hypothetical protein
MQRTNAPTCARLSKAGAAARHWVRGSSASLAAETLQGCPVVTAEGEKIGNIDELIIDADTHQFRYVIVSCKGGGASVALPWQSLYFDSALARLVFYTYV